MYKRTLAFLLALCMIVSVCPITALASETDDAADSGTFQFTYINPLYADVVTEADLNDAANQPPAKSVVNGDTEYSTTIEEAGASMRRGLLNRTENITVNYATSDSELVEEAVSDLMTDIFYSAVEHTGKPTEGDYLMWQFGGWKCSGSYTPSDDVYYLKLTYTLTYYTDYDQEQKVTETVEDLVDELLVSSMTDYQKVKAAYDWICSNVTYDNANLNDNSYTLKYTAYAALINKTAVCQGYALLLYRLALEMGVDCRLIPGTGNGEPHGWNILKVSDKYYNADSTWDAESTDYSWFLLSDKNFTKHTRDTATNTNPVDYTSESFYAAYPMSDSDYVPTEEDLTIPKETCGENAFWTLENGVLTISGTGAMADYSEKAGAPWSDSVDKITSVVIEEGITHIGAYAFYKCTAMTNIKFAKSVASIGEYGLFGCSALTGVTLPEGLTTLNQMALSNCTALKEITFPATLTTIDKMAMFECSALHEIYFLGDAPSFISSEAFSGVTATVYYPAANATWTADKLVNYNGTLTWVAYCPDGCTYKSVTTEATCTESGGTIYTCIACGAVVVENEKPALGHNYVDGVCTRCGEAEPVMVSPLVSGENVPATGKIKLTWEAVDYAVSYNVYRSDQKYDGYTLVGTVTDTSMVDDTAVACNTYYYCVTSVSANGKESELPEDFDNYILKCTCDLPQPEVTLSNVASSGKIKISWNAVEGATKYDVYKSTTGEEGTWSRISSNVTKTSVTNTKNLEPGQRYYYRVKALCDVEEAASAYSSVKSRLCDLAQPEVTLSNVASSGKIKISWNAVEGATGYNVYKSTTGKDGSWSRISSNVTKTSVTNTTNVEPGQKYYYKVKALCDVENAASAYSSVQSRVGALARPVVSITLTSSGQPKLTWDAVEGAVKYKVYKSTTGEAGTWSCISSNVTKTSVTNSKNIEVGQTYYYKVKAIAENTDANSAYSKVVFINCTSADISGSTVEMSVIDRINQYREYYGLEALEWYTEGEMAAKIRVAELAVSFDLNRPDGSSPETLWEAYEIYDECVASNFSNAVDLVDTMMEYEDTAAVCLYEEWTYAVAARNGNYWVVMFGAEDF